MDVGTICASEIMTTILSAVLGGVASHVAALYAQSHALEPWAIVALMLTGTCAGAGHPFKYLEHTMEAISLASVPTFGNAFAGLVAGVVAVLVSAAVGAALRAAALVYEAGDVAAFLLSVLCGYALCALLTLVPPEPESRRVNAFLALCTSAVSVALVEMRPADFG